MKNTINKMVFDGEPSIVSIPPPENGSVTLTFNNHFENLISSSPECSKYLGGVFVQIPSAVHELSSSQDFHGRHSVHETVTLTFSTIPTHMMNICVKFH